jgi:hypothetical protein
LRGGTPSTGPAPARPPVQAENPGPIPPASTGQDTSDLPQIFKLIELGSIVCFFPASLTRRYLRPEIAYRPVEDLEPAVLSVAWPQQSRSAAVAAFVRAAGEAAAAAQTGIVDTRGG